MTRWLADWVRIYLHPAEQTFLEVAASPAARPSTAYLWIFLAGVLFVTSSDLSYALATPAVLDDNYWLKLPIAALGIGGGLVLSFASSVAIKQWIAKLQSGTGAYAPLAYLFGAIYAPFALVASASALLAALSSMRIVAGATCGLAFLYALYLQILAVKSINRFGWKEAALSVLIPFAGVLVFCGLLYQFLM